MAGNSRRRSLRRAAGDSGAKCGRRIGCDRAGLDHRYPAACAASDRNPDPGRESIAIQPAGSTASIAAPLIPAPFSSIWALLPADLPLGPARAILTVDGVASTPAPLVVQSSAPGLFSKQLNGLGGALAQNQALGQAPMLNGLTTPVFPDQYVILWGTRLGVAQVRDVRVDFGGVEIAPEYAGPAPGVPGLDQINFRVPRNGIPDGCYVPVAVTAPASGLSARGPVSSNVVTLAKTSAAGSCRHPFGLTDAELSALDAGQRIAFGTAQLRSFDLPPSTDSAVADFFTEERVRHRTAGGLEPARGRTLTQPVGIVGVIAGGEGAAGALKLTGPGCSIDVAPLAACTRLRSIRLDSRPACGASKRRAELPSARSKWSRRCRRRSAGPIATSWP